MNADIGHDAIGAAPWLFLAPVLVPAPLTCGLYLAACRRRRSTVIVLGAVVSGVMAVPLVAGLLVLLAVVSGFV